MHGLCATGMYPMLIPVERDTTYTINSDASFTYTADYTYHNDGSVTGPVVIGFSVLFHGATVTTNNFDSFTFNGDNPGYFNEYGADFWLGYLDPQEVAVPISVNYDADGYTFTGHIDAGETKTFTISYSGPAGVWSQKSIHHPAFPWTDQTGWWELIGDGHAEVSTNFKVTVNLPSNTATYKIMGYDPSCFSLHQWLVIRLPLFQDAAGGKLDEHILFKTSEPLPIATSVSLNCPAPGVYLAGTPFTVSGTISPDAGLSVLIDYTSPSGIITTHTVTAGTLGAFSDSTFSPNELGTWTIQARFPAQGDYLPSQSNSLLGYRLCQFFRWFLRHRRRQCSRWTKGNLLGRPVVKVKYSEWRLCTRQFQRFREHACHAAALRWDLVDRSG